MNRVYRLTPIQTDRAGEFLFCRFEYKYLDEDGTELWLNAGTICLGFYEAFILDAMLELADRENRKCVNGNTQQTNTKDSIHDG